MTQSSALIINMGVRFLFYFLFFPLFNPGQSLKTQWSVSLAHITVARATKWHIRVGKSMEVWEYRASIATPRPG